MKKNDMKHFYIGAMVMLIIVIFALPLSAYAYEIRIEVKGELLDIPTSEQPVVIDGRTLVPLRAVSEALGFSVEWNAQMQRASLTKSDYTVRVQIGNNNMLVNEENISLDVPAQIINGRTMLPVRAIAEATGMDVIWNRNIRTVHVLEPFPPIENTPGQGIVFTVL